MPAPTSARTAPNEGCDTLHASSLLSRWSPRHLCHLVTSLSSVKVSEFDEILRKFVSSHKFL
jgi:hypothetical protein